MNHFTWMQYLEGLLVLLAVYYAAVLFKFYLPEFKTKVMDRRPSIAAPLSVLQYEEPISTEETEDAITDQTEQLIARLKQTISQTTELSALARDVVQIFKQYYSIKYTPLRAAINELVVTECEKTGITTLTEEQVDEWWK